MVNICRICCFWLIKHIICGYKKSICCLRTESPSVTGLTVIYCWGKLAYSKKNRVACFPIFVSRACNWWDIYAVMCALLSKQRLLEKQNCRAAVDNKMAGPFQCYLTCCFNMPVVVCPSEYEMYRMPSGFCGGLSHKYFLGQQFSIIVPPQLCSSLAAGQRRVHHLAVMSLLLNHYCICLLTV